MSPLRWLGCCMCLGAPSHTLFFLTQAEKGSRAHFKVSKLVLLFQQCAGMSPVETWTCTRLWYLRVSAQVSIFQGPLLRPVHRLQPVPHPELGSTCSIT